MNFSINRKMSLVMTSEPFLIFVLKFAIEEGLIKPNIHSQL